MVYNFCLPSTLNWNYLSRILILRFNLHFFPDTKNHKFRKCFKIQVPTLPMLKLVKYHSKFTFLVLDEQLSVFVQDTWLSIIRMIKNCRIEFTFMDGRSISTLIRLAQLDAIHLNLWSRTLTKEFTKNWLMICKALEGDFFNRFWGKFVGIF
jgi:hypothetical protein